MNAVCAADSGRSAGRALRRLAWGDAGGVIVTPVRTVWRACFRWFRPRPGLLVCRVAYAGAPAAARTASSCGAAWYVGVQPADASLAASCERARRRAGGTAPLRVVCWPCDGRNGLEVVGRSLFRLRPRPSWRVPSFRCPAAPARSPWALPGQPQVIQRDEDGIRSRCTAGNGPGRRVNSRAAARPVRPG